MRKRIYHRFPLNEVEFMQKYHFWDGLPFIVRTLAGMNSKTGSIEMKDSRNRILKAKRSVVVDIADSNIDFIQLTHRCFDNIITDIEQNGILDFRIKILYSYLDRDYRRIPTKGDTFLLRSDLADGILSLKVHKVDGPGYTTCNEIADTVVNEIGKGHID